MSNIKVVDVNNTEEAKQEETVEEVNEEAKEEINEVVEETPPQETNEIVEEAKEQPKQENKPVAQKVKAQDKLVRCPKCSREMKLKSYRYGHQQKCNGGIENTPVKPFSKPRAKPKAQPIVKEVYEEVEEEREALPVGNPKTKPKLSAPVSNQILKPRSAGLPSGNLPQSLNLVDFSSHYQLLQNQFIQQKKEKYNNLCQSMFSTKSRSNARH